MKSFRTAALTAVLLLAACGPGAAPKQTSDTEAPTGPSDRIQVPATVQDTLGLTFAAVERRRVRETIRLTGRFEFEHQEDRRLWGADTALDTILDWGSAGRSPDGWETAGPGGVETGQGLEMRAQA